MSSGMEQMETDARCVSAVKQETKDDIHLNELASQNLESKDNIRGAEGMHPNAVVEDENKMDVDVKDSIEIKEDSVPFRIKETEAGLMLLSIDGVNDDDDDDEIVDLSPEEIRTYLEDKIREYLTDPAVNPLMVLTKRSKELDVEFKEKSEEFNRLTKYLDAIYRKQEKFLRHMGILEKIPTKSIAISVDLPVEPDALNSLANNSQEILKAKMNAQNSAPGTIRAPVFLPPPNVPVTKEQPKTAEVKSLDNYRPQPKAIAPKPTSSSIECIDLTDEMDSPSTSATNNPSFAAMMRKLHPAPLPPRPYSIPDKTLPGLPPRPRLKVHAEERGIVLQWDMPTSTYLANTYAKLCAFDIFGYQEQANSPINTLLWKKIGSVKAMTLPMACTLTQFVEGNKYHFAIRAMDIHNRYGSYSDPISIIYTPVPKKCQP